MTKAEILALEGRALDAAVAAHVLGLRVGGEEMRPLRFVQMGDLTHPKHVLSYSGGWDGAGKVVEAMEDCLHMTEHGRGGLWAAEFCGYPNSAAQGQTAPLAICRAALLAVSGEKEASD